MRHYSEDELTLYYYGEGRRRADVERHLDGCPACAAVYREIAGTLAMVAAPEVPERGDQYGLEVWQRIRYRLPDQEGSWLGQWFRWDRLALAGAAAALVLVAFLAGRTSRQPAGAPPAAATDTSNLADATRAAGDARQRILITSVADHLDRSERVLTDIMNAPVTRGGGGDISTAQRWADDLLTTSRLYRQDAVDAGEQSVATVLDDLERSLLEIVHSPSQISAADLEQIRRRIDAAALLFKVRVMSDELRQREQPPVALSPRTSTRKVS
ncbi:MAG TPA: zf-HC2 domain-containing protein [Vicinamibacterales bacterium]|nr:zf-HC2 domain-containing protein [Vicinamibacterales bacterium]